MTPQALKNIPLTENFDNAVGEFRNYDALEADVLYTNLASNPSLETNATNWSANAGSAITRSEAWASHGLTSLRVTSTSSVDARANYCNQFISARIPCTPGERLSTSAMVNAILAPGTFIRLFFDFWDTTNLVYVGTGGTGATTTTKTGTGVGLISQVGATAPFNARYFNVFVQCTSGGAQAVDYFVDDLLIVRGTTAPSYFDGDSEDARWTGVPHASTSELLSRSSDQRGQLRKQKHVDIRSFVQENVTARIPMLYFDRLSMVGIDTLQMSALNGQVTVERGEQWSAGTVGRETDRNNTHGMSLACATGTNISQSVIHI